MTDQNEYKCIGGPLDGEFISCVGDEFKHAELPPPPIRPFKAMPSAIKNVEMKIHVYRKMLNDKGFIVWVHEDVLK